MPVGTLLQRIPPQQAALSIVVTVNQPIISTRSRGAARPCLCAASCAVVCGNIHADAICGCIQDDCRITRCATAVGTCPCFQCRRIDIAVCPGNIYGHSRTASIASCVGSGNRGASIDGLSVNTSRNGIRLRKYGGARYQHDRSQCRNCFFHFHNPYPFLMLLYRNFFSLSMCTFAAPFIIILSYY